MQTRTVAIGTGAVAATVLAGAWLHTMVADGVTQMASVTVLVPLLMAAIYVARHRPIHVHANTKVYVASVTYFLTVVLLPPALASLTLLVACAIAGWSIRSRTGNTVWDITIMASRWSVIGLGASTIAHLSGMDRPVQLGLTAAFMWAGDILTFPLIFSPNTGESPVRAVVMAAREAGLVEAAQYLIGVMAALEQAQGYWALALFILPTVLVYYAFRQAKEVSSETRKILENMADVVDLKDPYTGGHSRRVAKFTRSLLRELRVEGQEMELIVSAARVHDIGKIGIADAVLRKPGALTSEEQVAMDTHPERGAELLSGYQEFKRGATLIRHHHEAWDGSGYPHRLREKNIPYGARVIAVVDAYDAMTTDRPYRRGMSPEAAAAILREGRGRQWDPEIVDAFLRVLGEKISPPLAPVLHVVPDMEEHQSSTA